MISEELGRDSDEYEYPCLHFGWEKIGLLFFSTIMREINWRHNRSKEVLDNVIPTCCVFSDQRKMETLTVDAKLN